MLYSIVLLVLLPFSLFSFSIMLEPAGDAKITGRCIDDSFERGIALQYTQQLKQLLEERIPGVRVAITRLPGETITEFQNAHFANRMAIDLYISINFFKEKEVIPHLYIYSYAQHDDADFRQIDLCFYRYDQIHLYHAAQTKKWSNLFCDALNQEQYKKKLQCPRVCRLPFKPLLGIKASSIAIEIGLKNKDDWPQFIDPCFSGIVTIIRDYEKGTTNDTQ